MRIMTSPPRLDPSPAVSKTVEELAVASLETCQSARSVSHPLAWHDPLGGTPIDHAVLARLAERLTDAARLGGYPSEVDRDTRTADIEMSIVLYETLGLAPAAAIEPGVWNFLSVVLVPDLVRWRFPAREGGSREALIDRWLVGGRSFRQAFERLWWRACLLRDARSEDPWATLRRLLEDDFIALVERPHLVGYSDAVLALARTVLARVDRGGVNQGSLMRAAAKRLLRRAAFVELHALDAKGLDALMDGICREAEEDLVRSGRSDPAKDGLPDVPPLPNLDGGPMPDSGRAVKGGPKRRVRHSIDEDAILRKLVRIRAGGTPRCVDLFAGCGGISLGMARAGFEAVAGLDIDAPSMRTWWSNLRREAGVHLRASPSVDLVNETAAEALASCGFAAGPQGVDVLVGGPPCQAYSRIGRGKIDNLRGVGAHLEDERGALYLEFLRFVEECSPLAVLIENVPDAISYGSDVVPVKICEKLDRLGYRSHFTILNSANYGVPQLRERVFILAVHRLVSDSPIPFPAPTHRIVRQSEVRQIRSRMAGVVHDHPRWGVMPPVADADLPIAVTVAEALRDLPVIRSRNRNGGNLGCTDLQGLLAYSAAPECDYQRGMRNWPGFGTDGYVSGNMLRRVDRDFEVFARMNPGDEYPAAHRIHEELFLAEIEQRRRSGQAIREGDPLYTSLHREMVPPYDTTKFTSKWWKMQPNYPSRTVVAHLQMDTYSHIHFDSDQARGITVREAARLQSFPDGFRFSGAMKEGYRQIGNAVPPVAAFSLGTAIYAAIADNGRKPIS